MRFHIAARRYGWLRMTSRLTQVVLFLACATFGVHTLNGQAVAGLTGSVTDSTGAVVTGAQVTITNEATGVATKVTTSGAGTYATTGLLPGSYTVTVEASGFRKSEQTGVLVEASKTDTINVTLTAGSSTQTVQVTASAIALNTTQPQISSTVQPAIVAALPVEVSGRGRQVDSLQFLAPGTSGSAFSHRVDGGVDFEEEIVYNGIPAPQPETQGYTTNFNPPWGLIQEATVERTTFAAQYGLGQGAYSYQTVSGTNHYHGNLFEINRNSYFDSDGFFNGPSFGGPAAPPPDHENNYGFDIGGPISIPHLYNGHDRTFGHYSQEWYKQNNEDTAVSTVPTALEKTGNFSDFVNGSTGQLIPIYVPPGVTCGGLTPGEQFPGNIIPAACISPTSAILIPYIPNPDRPGSGIGGLDSNKSFTPFINPHIQHVWGFTVDQVLTPKQSLHYAEWRNSFSNYSFDNNPLVIAPNPLNSMKYEPALGSIFLLDYSNTITPNLVMTVGAGWIGELNNQFNQTRYSFPAISQGIIPPYITWDGQHSLTDWGTQGSWLQSINRKLGLAFVNNWLWTKGKNTFNIGQEFRRSYQDDNEEQTEGGQFSFSQRETSIPNPSDPNFGNYGSSFASFMLGIPDEANRSNSQELELRNLDYSPYIQDDLRLTRKLTLNLGVRWDIMQPFTENHDLIVFFDPTIANPAANGLPGAMTKFGNCTGCAGYERAPINWKHFGPRLGFAYELNNKTVLQGGYSVAFLDGGAYEYGTNKVAVNYGNLLTGSFTQTSSGTNVSSYGSWDTHILPNPTATPFSPGLGVGGVQVDAFSKSDNYAPYAQMWNVNVQRQLPSQLFATIAYVGTRDIHLPSQLNSINQLNPGNFSQQGNLGLVFTATGGPGSAQAAGYTTPYANFVSQWGGSATVAQALTPYPQYGYIFNNFEGDGTSFYNAMQLELDKRFSNGLAFLAGYTLASEYNNTASGFTSFISNALNRYNQKLEWAPTSGAPPQTFKISGTYELPIGPGKAHFNNHGVTGQILGGWQAGWLVDEEAGTPTGPTENLTFPYPNGGGNRPDRTTAGLSSGSYGSAAKYFSKRASVAQIWAQDTFSQTAPYTLGNAYRNYSGMKEPAYYNEDADLIKHFYFGDRFSGSLRVDYFNLLNRVQFEGPDTNFSDGTFGQVISQGQQNSTRQGQVQFQLQF
ncbi:MAG: carboxypeptidase regulatory-like domain-containing protein [Acidobacteriaceae bacterium]